MIDVRGRVPPIVQGKEDDQRAHVFFIHSPIALIMSMMIVDRYALPRERVLAVNERGMNVTLSGLESVGLKPRKYDRYINRLTGRNFGAIRLARTLRSAGRRFVVYASWFYSAIEEITRSPLCDGVVIFEEGQMSYHPATPYRHSFRNTWRFREKVLFNGVTNLWFREDVAAYISLSPDAFPAMPPEQRFVLDNIAAATRNYTPQLTGVHGIGLMPAPRRLPVEAVFPAIEKLIEVIPGRGSIRLHPGYKFEKYYAEDRFAAFIERTSDDRVTLCPDEAIIELEMVRERKILYGAQTSLSRYAALFGSRFEEVSFDQYIKPII